MPFQNYKKKSLDFFEVNSHRITSVNTFDVENLFGNIPHKIIIEIFKKYLKRIQIFY